MHTNQQTIKKNYLNQIKEIFLASRVDNSRSFYLFIFPYFPGSSKSFLFTTGYVWSYKLTKVFFLELLIFSTHEIKRLDGGKKSETLSFFFPLIFYHPLMPRVLPLFIICLELISTIGSSGIFKY